MSEATPPAGPSAESPAGTAEPGEPAASGEAERAEPAASGEPAEAPASWAASQWTPPPGPEPEPVVDQPRSIRIAVGLMWVGAVTTLLGIASVFLQYDELRREVRRSDPTLSVSEVDTAVSGALTFIGLIGVVTIGLWMWMAFANGQGRTWARTVATVLGSLNVVATLFRLALVPQTGLSVVLTLLGIALAVSILLLLHRPRSSGWYAYQSRFDT